MLELNLNFPNPQQLVVSLVNDKTGEKTGILEFNSPFSGKGHQQLSWYLEQYANQYSSDIDDESAKRIESQLPELGKALFNKVFAKKSAHQLYKKFRQQKDNNKIITITANHPLILSLPWELLHDSKGKNFLTVEKIAIQRRVNCQNPTRINPQQKLHILFIISRPTNVDFTDPHVNSQAALDTLQNLSQKITVEFLQPATVQKLQERLQNKQLPHVDIIHFDGYSVFDENADPTDDIEALPAYLLFEQEDGTTHKVSAPSFAKTLNQQQVSLVILSAAANKIADMNSVAASLITAGVPFVLSMNYSLLQPAAQKVFKVFYTGLIHGYKVGDAVNNARFALYQEPDRRDLIRLNKPAKIELYDWFVPTFYHHGYDAPLLIREDVKPNKIRSNRNNLPVKSIPKFFGHRRDLWNMERQLVHGKRHMNLHGPDGYGKTSLVQELGRWLQKTNQISSVVYIDYANTRNIDPISIAISSIAKVLQKNLTDVDSVTQALARTPTLIIFDNIDALGENNKYDFNEKEALIFQEELHPLIVHEGETKTFFFNDEPVAKLPADSKLEKIVVEEEYEKTTEFHFSFTENEEIDKSITDNVVTEELQPIKPKPIKENSLAKLLDVAKKWSEVGQSCVIAISRYPNPKFLTHCQLGKLEPIEAVRYFDTAMINPPVHNMPNRRKLEQLFEQVDYNPLAINILTYRLQRDDINDLTNRLANELHRLPINLPPENRAVQATILLFTETLEPQMRRQLPKLRVFQNGAFENVLRSIINVPESQWRPMRRALENSGLVQVENFDGLTVEYLEFHPSIASIGELSSVQHLALQDRYQQGYYELANFLYNEEGRNPYHANIIEQKELPNLLTAAYGAVETGKDWARDFGNKVDSFLSDFGLVTSGKQFAKATKDQIEELAEHSEDWFEQFSEQVKQLMAENHQQEAQEMLEGILEYLPSEPNYERCLTLGRLGNCAKLLNNSDQAIENYQQQLIELQQLEASDQVNREIARAGTHLADVLTHKGEYNSAEEAYIAALSIMQSLNDVNSIASIHAKLGTVQKLQSNFQESEQNFHQAYLMFKQMDKPQNEAASLHQLGMVYQQTRQWKAANQAYSQANSIFEQQNDLVNTIITWQQLAHVNQMLGNLPAAEDWYRQAIEGNKTLENWTEVSIGLTNLAELLQDQLGRLEEAKQLAEAGLAIDKAHNPADVEIWKTYLILAKIADKQHNTKQADIYRKLANESKTGDLEDTENLETHKKFIEAVVTTIKQPKLRKQLDSMLEQRKLRGWDKLVAAVQRFLDGEKDVEYIAQTEQLDVEDAMIVHNIARKTSESKLKI
ncbi:MAG: tetratricopeptide repeat protein [Candidatus Marithrix sp.]